MLTSKRLLLFQLLKLFLLLSFAFEGVKGRYAELINNGYQNVTVAISDQISESQRSSIVSGVESLFESASSLLYTATGKRAYFANVIIIYPPSWDDNYQNTGDSSFPAFYSADIRIAPENAAYGDLPYTQQSRGCGEPGDFIHLTPYFVTDYNYMYTMKDYFGSGPKLLVHEWIKYRYGVFDENGYAFSYTYPQMYFGSKGTSYNMCNNTMVTWDQRSCHYDGDIDGLPSDCNLEAYQYYTVTTSMMSLISLSVASKMCDDESHHNEEAPNKQNFLCHGQNVMEVILQHEDFQNGNNPPSDVYSTYPGFHFTYGTNENIVLFLIWDPMTSDQTYYSAGPSLEKFIYMNFPTSSYIGAIETLHPSSPVISMTQVTNDNRYTLWNKLLSGLRSSETPVGNIDSAVATAIQDLDNIGANDYSSYGIVVLSNTEGKTPWNTICPYVVSEGVQLHLITYNNIVAQEFDAFCEGRSIVIETPTPFNFTNEPIFSITDVQNEYQDYESVIEDIEDCWTQLGQRAQLDLALLSLPAILSDFTLPTVYYLRTFYNSTEESFEADKAHLDTTYFYVETCRNIDKHPPANLISVYFGTSDTQNAPNYHYDCTVQAFFSEAPLMPSTSGSWTFNVEQSGSIGINVPYMVYAIGNPVGTASSVNSTTIVIRGWVVTTNLTMVRIYTSVTRGTTPVYNAKVEATVTNSRTGRTTRVTLVDNGSGNPDISTEDGVYSSYFTEMDVTEQNATNSYNVVVEASDNGNLATYPTYEYPWISMEKKQDVAYTAPFHLTDLLQFSAYKDEDAEIRPGEIYDLRVTATQNDQVTLEWTAPGRDLDYGIAARYIFKCSTNRNDLINHFDDLPDSEIPRVLPEAAKSTQAVIFQGIIDYRVHFCAIKTYSGFNTNSEWSLSNIISYYIETGHTEKTNSPTKSTSFHTTDSTSFHTTDSTSFHTTESTSFHTTTEYW